MRAKKQTIESINRLLDMSWHPVGKTSVRRNGKLTIEEAQIDHVFTSRVAKVSKLTEPGDFRSDHALLAVDVFVEKKLISKTLIPNAEFCRKLKEKILDKSESVDLRQMMEIVGREVNPVR